jgi:hypothetical protein
VFFLSEYNLASVHAMKEIFFLEEPSMLRAVRA